MSGTIFMMMTAAKKLPYKRRVAYLESSGTQYIDTGIIFDPAQSMEGVVRSAAISSGRSVIFSSYYALGNTAFGTEWGGFANSHTYTPRAYLQIPNILDVWDGVQTASTPTDISLLWTPDTKTATLNVGGTEYTAQSAGSLGQPGNYTIWMFLDHRAGVSAIANGTRIYSLSLRKGGTLVRDLIPVIDWTDRPAMYDQVSGQLFYNQGTGEFSYA